MFADVPLFIDPFLLFQSHDLVYKKQHDFIIEYVKFLHQKTLQGNLSEGDRKNWFYFSEIKQTWLGVSDGSNQGRGLGKKFADALMFVLPNLMRENKLISTKSEHIEKLSLIGEGVGKDGISDFTTNLILKMLCEYTEKFAQSYLNANQRKLFRVPSVEFSFQLESWIEGSFTLPVWQDDYVLLVPKNILTRSETWISPREFYSRFGDIPLVITDASMRAKIDNYFKKALPDKPTQKERAQAKRETLIEFPILADAFIKIQEDNGDLASGTSAENVVYIADYILKSATGLRARLSQKGMYGAHISSESEARRRISYVKSVIENNDGYKLLYRNGKAMQREDDLRTLIRLAWIDSNFDLNNEVNNGRGPVDATVSYGRLDKSVVEFKLASNSKLPHGMQKQVDIYAKANQTNKKILVILFFTEQEESKVRGLIVKLNLQENREVVLIDARSDNKPSASKAN